MTDVCVTGDSLPALLAALECAEVGLSVRLVIGSTSGAGWPVRSERDQDGALAALLERIAAPIAEGGPATAAVLPLLEPPVPVSMRNKKQGWSAVPEPAVLGMPAVPMSEAALAFLSAGEAFRAYLDRVKPLLTLGKTQQLDDLVRTRFGAGLLRKLVLPFVRERFGADDAEVAIAAPGLNEKLSQVGALSAAVLAYADRQREQETRVLPVAGWSALREALLERLSLYRVETVVECVGCVTHGCDARGRIVDVGVSPAEGAAGELADLTPQRTRMHVSGPIERLTGIYEGAPVTDGGSLIETTLAAGDAWTVRLTAGSGDQRIVAHAAGPAGGTGAGSATGVCEEFVAAGLELAVGARVWVAAAPFTSLAERDAAAERLSDFREAHPVTLPIGRALHGDDLAHSVADASAASVTLRRRLVGIAD